VLWRRFDETGAERSSLGAPLALAALVIAGPAVQVARAAAPTGACCSPNGSCQEVIAQQCAGPGESFIGTGRPAPSIDCAAPVAAPVLSIVGTFAAAGALAAVGIGRLVTRRRRAK
jgi:hypothetical protein